MLWDSSLSWGSPPISTLEEATMSQHDDMPHNQDSEDYLGPSKSQLKREMHALQELGKRMLDLSDEQLASLTISDLLKAAIVESRRITQREARRRHLQYIGKIIRQEDDPEAVSRANCSAPCGNGSTTPNSNRWGPRPHRFISAGAATPACGFSAVPAVPGPGLPAPAPGLALSRQPRPPRGRIPGCGRRFSGVRCSGHPARPPPPTPGFRWPGHGSARASGPRRSAR